MPIYAYRCTACGHAQDVLQKMSDPLLTVCPACGVSAYAKQLTAAGFQLKGSGWYVTDFRGGNTAAPKPAEGGDAVPSADKAGEKTADQPSEKTAEKSSEKAADKPKEKPKDQPKDQPKDKPAATPAPAPAAGTPTAGSGS